MTESNVVQRLATLGALGSGPEDVANDPRYLTTIGGTRGEMIQPILSESGVVVGTIDVESNQVNAFSGRDEEFLTACAQNLFWLWSAGG